MDWDLAAVADTAELCLSELVTNAITHAEHPAATIQLELLRQGDLLRGAVRDVAANAMPQPREPEEDAEHGRGLVIVRALAAAWGVELAHDGLSKTVWFELKTDLQSSPSPDGVREAAMVPGVNPNDALVTASAERAQTYEP